MQNMFSHNQKISARQMKAILILDGLAKLCLLLPICLAGRSLGTMVICLAAGFLFWFWFARFLESVLKEGQDFFCLFTERVGIIGGWIVYLAGFFYFLSHTAVCMNLCAELAQTYLLPQVPLPVLTLLPLAAGWYLSISSVEVQGRLGELTVPVLLGLFLLMEGLASAGMNLGTGEQLTFAGMNLETGEQLASSGMNLVAGEPLPWRDDKLASGIYEVFAVMGGMFLPVLFPCLQKQEKQGHLLCRAACWTLIPAGILVFITAGSFGTRGMLDFEFPTVRVMSNVTAVGGFLQRWDVFFLLLILFSLTFSVGSGFWYLQQISGRIWQETAEMRKVLADQSAEKKDKTGTADAGIWQTEFASELTEFDQNRTAGGFLIFQAGIALVIFCLACGFQNPEAAVNYYRAFNLYLLTPLMLIMYLLLYSRENRKKKRKKAGMGVLFLAVCLLLTGCTARELEDRMFPMALEVRMEEDHLTVIYGWNEEKEDDRLTMFRGETLSEILQQAAEYSDRCIDYSHVKALILDEELQGYPELNQELYEWLVKEPAFAASLIIYPARESGLSLELVAQRSEGKIGEYLENLYENNQRLREMASTLGEMASKQV